MATRRSRASGGRPPRRPSPARTGAPRAERLPNPPTDEELRQVACDAWQRFLDGEASDGVLDLHAAMECMTNVLWSLVQGRGTVVFRHEDRPAFLRHAGHPTAARALERLDELRRLSVYGAPYARIRGHRARPAAAGEIVTLRDEVRRFLASVQERLP